MESQDWIKWIATIPVSLGLCLVVYGLLRQFGPAVWRWLKWRRLMGLSLLVVGVVLVAPFAYPYLHLVVTPVQDAWPSYGEGAKAVAGEGLEGGRILVPRLKLSAPIMESIEEDGLQDAVGHVPGTAYPWERGNTVIIGENYMAQWGLKMLFSVLHLSRQGDLVVIEHGAMKYEYRIRHKKVVEEDEMYDYVGPSDRAELTLITCYPPGTRWKRLIIFADKT